MVFGCWGGVCFFFVKKLTRKLIFCELLDIFAGKINLLVVFMVFDLLFPQKEEDLFDAPCIVAAVYFDKDELLGFGVDNDAVELNEAFIDYNEFDKAFKLWNSPKYLSDFFDRHQRFLEAEYWRGITEREFLKDVARSLGKMKNELRDSMENNGFPELVEPLDEDEEKKRLTDSIRVKIKKGKIKGHYPFRFYAVEIEENKCYLITGSAIKVHKDMKKAPNTEIEFNKLLRVYTDLSGNGVNTKDAFISYLLGKE